MDNTAKDYQCSICTESLSLLALVLDEQQKVKKLFVFVLSNWPCFIRRKLKKNALLLLSIDRFIKDRKTPEFTLRDWVTMSSSRVWLDFKTIHTFPFSIGIARYIFFRKKYRKS
jgi:hypothetical protein